jgi:tripartite-type tricarboxylate transporter receptor subunit TctC
MMARARLAQHQSLEEKTMALTLKALLIAALLAAGSAFAQQYPSKPIRYIVPFAPGGGIDILSRAFAPKLGAQLGQPVVVENRPASAGIVGAEATAKSAPDGYTIMTGGSWLVVGSLMYKSLPYQVDRDFTPVAMLADASIQLMTHTSIPASTVKEFVDYSKANPGKLNYGSAGVGHPFHLAMELFKSRTGADLVHVPYKGMNPAVQDFLGGRTQAIFYSANAQLAQMVKEGKIRVIATATEQRLPAFPDVPTMDEIGIRGFKPAGNLSLIAPAGLPRPVVDRLHRELVAAAGSPEVTSVYDKLLFLKTLAGPDEYAQVVRRELETWGPLVKKLNITLDTN